MKKKMLYIMHINWGWIKQRPQFAAEGLANVFDVTIAHQMSYKTKDNTSEKSTLKVFKFFALPFKSRSRTLSIINKFLVRLEFRLFVKVKLYDFIWITYPELYEYISDLLNKDTVLIYDCMDDVLEFPNVIKNNNLKDRLFSAEKLLCINSKQIFCSSDYLKSKIIQRYSLSEDKVMVINNGISFENLKKINHDSDFLNKFFLANGKKKIVYIGTISHWFDFDLLFYSLDKIDNIEYLLFGPTEVQIPQHERIIYAGSVKHEYVSLIMKNSDVLVMPFTVNELIKSVNPVKAYEYIYSGKPSLIVEYAETQKFVPYLYLYKDMEDYVKQLQLLIEGKSKSIDIKAKISFLEQSQWSYKIKQFTKALADLKKKSKN